MLVRGLNTLAATISTPQAAPVIAGTRLRGGSANTACGAAGFAAEAIGAARAAGCTGTILTRAGSGFYTAAFIAACRRAGAYFSVTARMDPAVRAAIAAIPEDAWTAIRYPRAIWDDQLRAWVSGAEIAEIACTAFASKKGQAVTARLIVRRVRDLNKKAAGGQDELFPVWRYHPVFTGSPFALAQAEEQHRDTPWSSRCSPAGPTARLLICPTFAANAAWTACAAITCNLLRAAGSLASRFHARARGATIRAGLIDVAARLARRGRGQLTLHLPQYWHRESEWPALFEAACGPPARAA